MWSAGACMADCNSAGVPDSMPSFAAGYMLVSAVTLRFRNVAVIMKSPITKKLTMQT